MSTNNLHAEDLDQFIGSEQWYRHGLVRSITYTDGAKYVADHGGAYWLLDEIALAQKFNAAVKAELFQVWKLAVNDRRGLLTCDDGNGNSFIPNRFHSRIFLSPRSGSISRIT